MQNKYPGKLILFEGCEGGGKSTLIKALYGDLIKLGFKVVSTKEPGHDTPMGKKIREMLLDPNFPMTPSEELNLFMEGRREHFEKIIVPALKTPNTVILCDRSSPSTIAYQHYGRGLDLTDILVQDARVRQNTNFDLIILLDIDPEIGLKRKKPETRFELEKIEFHRRVRFGYLDQAKDDPDKRWVVIDASLPFDAVKNKALMTILKTLRRS